MPTHSLSPPAEQVRRHDRERFVTALFAAPPRREDLMVLYAFNVEVAQVREQVREPVAGSIRLQWWRDVVAGGRPAGETAGHPVAGPLRALLNAGALPPSPLQALLEAREQDLSAEPFPDLAALEVYAGATAGGLAEAALTLLGESDSATLAAGRAVGTAYALAGLLRALPFHLSIGRVTLPAAVLAACGTSAEALAAGQAPRASVAQAARKVGERARALLAEARRTRIRRAALAPLLPATLASGHLHRLERAGWDAFDPAVARLRPMPLRLAVNAALGRF